MTSMGLFRKSRFHSSSVRVIELTDSRRAVVARRPARNLLWSLLSLPGRIWMGFWNWLMESRPGGYPKYRR